MHLIQLLIPIYDNEGRPFPRTRFDGVRAHLIDRFGGLTAFVQSPALGLWKDAENGTTARDDMILVEVMVETFEREWWSAYRTDLERIFRQDELVIRAIVCEQV
ncbi:MAG: hypothetical protein IV085_10065 [Thiobacillus sp.]|nr:hypothetical protein [Thiobacillus sp.]